MSAAQGIVDFVRGFGQRAKQAHVNDALKNYLTDPEAAITAVNQIDPSTGIALNEKHRADVATAAATQKTTADARAGAFTRVTGYLRALPEGSDYGQALDGMTPFLKTQLGADDAEIGQWKQAIAANPTIITALDDKANEARASAQYGDKVVTPGAAYVRGGQRQFTQPFAPQVKVVPDGKGGNTVLQFDPNSGDPTGAYAQSGPAPAGGTGGAALTVDALRPHFIAQESGGNYGAVNAKTGALGKYQVMPATAKALAKRLGLGWRQDMMSGTDEASQRYQEQIGSAAIQEAIDHSGGDPNEAFAYYYAGPDKSRRGAKTARYVSDMQNRTGLVPGNGGQAPNAAPAPAGGGTRVLMTNAGVGKGVRAATPEELQGYPAGTMAQIDGNGKLVNLKTPPAGIATAQFKTGVKQRDDYLFAKGRTSAVNDQLDEVSAAVASITQDPNLDGVVGNVSGRLPSFLSQSRATFNNNLETLKTKLGLQALQLMRDMSKTGGALGQVSNYENHMLQRSIANLDTSSDPDTFRRNLGIVQNNINRAKKRMGIALGRMPGASMEQAGGAPAAASPASTDSPPTIGARRYNKQGAFVVWNGKGWVPGKDK